MAAKLVVVLALVAAAQCSVAPVARLDTDYTSFAYDVADPNTGDYKGQVETRVGGNVVGQYSLLDSDGTKRTVDYAADDVNGFNAVVRKDPALVAAPVVAAAPAVIAARTYAAPAIAPAVVAARTYAAPAIAPGIVAARTYAAPAFAPGIVAARTYGAPAIAPGIVAARTLAAPSLYAAAAHGLIAPSVYSSPLAYSAPAITAW